MQIFRFSPARVKVHQISHVRVSFSSKFRYFSSVTRNNSSVLFTETLYAVQQGSTSKGKISDLPLFTLKFTKFFMSFVEQGVSFSLNFASPFSDMRHSPSVHFHLNLYMIWAKWSNEMQIYRLLTARMKINQNLHAIFQATSQFSFQFWITFQCHVT